MINILNFIGQVFADVGTLKPWENNKIIKFYWLEIIHILLKMWEKILFYW